MQKLLYMVGLLCLWAATPALAQSNEQIPRHKALIENNTNYLVVVDLILDGNVTYLKLGPRQKRYHILYKPGSKTIGNWWGRLRTKTHKEHSTLKGKSHYVVYFDWKQKRWKFYKKR